MCSPNTSLPRSLLICQPSRMQDEPREGRAGCEILVGEVFVVDVGTDGVAVAAGNV